MKKVYQSQQQKRHRAARARRQATRRRRTKQHVQSAKDWGAEAKQRRKARRLNERKARARIEASRYKASRKVVAPRHFSFVDNTDEVSVFYSELRRKSKANKRRELFVDFQDVEKATLDAFTVLVCIASDLFHEYHTRFALGDITNDEVERLTKKSGFDALTRGNRASANEAYSGSFSRKSSNRVEPVEAERQVEFAARQVFRRLRGRQNETLPRWVGYKKRAAIRTLIECMSNTKGHASAHGGEHEDWWLSVYYDHQSRAAEFSFVDNGVGILKSGNVSRYDKAKAALTGRKSPDLLQDAIDGKIPSQTGQNGRGNGLPTMQADCCDHSLLTDLVVIANDAKVEVGARVHTVLRNGFDGTFINWRITDEEVST